VPVLMQIKVLRGLMWSRLARDLSPPVQEQVDYPEDGSGRVL
jgi:hypothetical protein